MPGKNKSSLRPRFAVGDRVRFLNHRKTLSWGDRKPQEFGFIIAIDGAYILVRPRWWKADEAVERYPNEIAPA